MFKNKAQIFKMLIVFPSLILIFNCNEDYVSSLSQVSPSISIETSDNFSNLLLGETIEDLELVLKIEDSPSISAIAVSVSYNSDNFQGEEVEVQGLSDQFFNNDDENAQILDCESCPIQEGLFLINTGLHQNQDTEHANGSGEIAVLHLAGKNIQTDFNISIDQILSYDFPEYECGSLSSDTNCDSWSIENLSIGSPIPELYFDNFIFSEDGSPRLSMSLNVSNLPKVTNSELIITYDSDVLNFIEYVSPIKGDLTEFNFDLSHSDSDGGGEITFIFNQQAGNNSHTQGEGSLVVLEFDVFSQNSLAFTSEFNEAIYATDNYEYDVSFWGTINKNFEWYGCTNPAASNYNEDVIFDNGSCEYDSQDPEQIGG